MLFGTDSLSHSVCSQGLAQRGPYLSWGLEAPTILQLIIINRDGPLVKSKISVHRVLGTFGEVT